MKNIVKITFIFLLFGCPLTNNAQTAFDTITGMFQSVRDNKKGGPQLFQRFEELAPLIEEAARDSGDHERSVDYFNEEMTSDWSAWTLKIDSSIQLIYEQEINFRDGNMEDDIWFWIIRKDFKDGKQIRQELMLTIHFLNEDAEIEKSMSYEIQIGQEDMNPKSLSRRPHYVLGIEISPQNDVKLGRFFDREGKQKKESGTLLIPEMEKNVLSLLEQVLASLQN